MEPSIGCRLSADRYQLPITAAVVCRTVSRLQEGSGAFGAIIYCAPKGATFPLTGIYLPMSHHLQAPRSFAVAQDDSERREGNPVTLTLYSSPERAIPSPLNLLNQPALGGPNPLSPGRQRRPSRRPVFNTSRLKCSTYRDSSPAAQNDGGAGSQARNAVYKTHRPTGRYHHPLNPLHPLNLLNNTWALRAHPPLVPDGTTFPPLVGGQ